MTKRLREYADRDHEVMDTYYDLCEEYNGRNAKSIKRRLERLIEKNPNFFDSYLSLYEILQDEGNLDKAEKVLDGAYERAIKLITDKEGNWPDILEWAWLENRHIIRTLLNKAISLWERKEVDGALDLFRKLLRTNPGDNLGARDYILAIRQGMRFEDFEKHFNKGGFYDKELTDEFDWWEKAVEKYY
jgi:tetratricopeptide (TPR) repeat protein